MVTHVNKASMTLYFLPSTLCHHCPVPPQPRSEMVGFVWQSSCEITSQARRGRDLRGITATLNEPRTLLHPTVDLHR